MPIDVQMAGDDLLGDDVPRRRRRRPDPSVNHCCCRRPSIVRSVATFGAVVLPRGPGDLVGAVLAGVEDVDVDE